MTEIVRLLNFLRPHWRGILLSVGLGTLTIGSGIALMATSAYLISAAALLPSIAELQVAIVGVRFFGISRGVFRYLERLTSHSVALQLLADLRVWFYQAIEPLAPAGLQKRHSGDLLARSVSDIDTLKDFFVRVVAPPLIAFCIALAFGIFLNFFSLLLSLTALTAILFVGIVVPIFAHILSRRAQTSWVAARASAAKTIIDAIQGLPDLLTNNADDRQMQVYADLTRDAARSESRLAWIGGVHTSMTSLGMNFGAWAVLLLAIPLVSNGHMPGVALAVVALGTIAAFEAVLPLGQAAQSLKAQLISAYRLFEIVDSAPPINEPNHTSPEISSSHLSIRNLNFAYETDSTVFANLSLDLPPGSKVAILGASGAGKSSLLNLLLRFWDFSEGKVSLGGVDIRQLPGEVVRSQFAVVPQQVHIFNARIEDNLRLAKPDATPADLTDAARRTHLLDFIEAQPEGWQTWAGEHGLRLSGGERQRLGVARALLRESPILLLDEFTTHLDTATAAAILSDTLEAARERSVVLITHSLEGLQDFDTVYEMADGHLTQTDKP